MSEQINFKRTLYDNPEYIRLLAKAKDLHELTRIAEMHDTVPEVIEEYMLSVGADVYNYLGRKYYKGKSVKRFMESIGKEPKPPLS